MTDAKLISTVQALRSKLDAQLETLQKQAAAYVTAQSPIQNKIPLVAPTISPVDNSVAQPVTQQLPEANFQIAPEGLLMKLYGEFVKRDESRELVAGLNKFARFTQSELTKAAVVQ